MNVRHLKLSGRGLLILNLIPYFMLAVTSVIIAGELIPSEWVKDWLLFAVLPGNKLIEFPMVLGIIIINVFFLDLKPILLRLIISCLFGFIYCTVSLFLALIFVLLSMEGSLG